MNRRFLCAALVGWLAVVVCPSLARPDSADADDKAAKELERLAVPTKLLPKGKVLFLLRAEGVQVYKAEKKDGALKWVLDGPKAVLLDFDTTEKVGTHSKGPVWQIGDDSKTAAKLVASSPAPRVAAVPWLLLETTGEKTGRFRAVSHVLRIDTWGGQPPAAAPAKAGDVREVRYHATYAFFGAKK
jgi:hypothetical protein